MGDRGYQIKRAIAVPISSHDAAMTASDLP
jgi:hypothetical protein